MRNFKLLLLTLVLFVLIVPVMAMPNYSVQKTESVFQKQSDHFQIVLNVKGEPIVFQSRAIVTENLIYKSFMSFKLDFIDKKIFPLTNYYFGSNFYHKKIPNSIV